MNPFRALLLISLLVPALSFGAEAPKPAPSAAPLAPGADPKRLDVDSLKQKYWAHGTDGEYNVVQNRIYTKALKINVEPMGGFIGSDPFLNTWVYGLQVGFNPLEYLGFDVIYLHASTAPTSANSALLAASGFGANSNPINNIIGGELTGSFLYGKLSLLGKAIIHFDLYALAGGGAIFANNGASGTGWVGFGEQAFITTWLTFRTDFRFYIWQENVVELFRPATIGNILGQRLVFAPAGFVGFNFLFP
ncbi:MAG: outer membrane beta-barrel domain-containing protein [Bdellovibrionota bacterium]